MDENELKENMVRENPEFRQVFDEHRLCEEAIEHLRGKSFLTDEEKLEEKALKKKKLILKDKMYLMMAEYKKAR